MSKLIVVASLLCCLFLLSCGTGEKEKLNNATSLNAAVYFEIPVTDMERAKKFYESVFSITLQRDTIDGNEMCLFPLDNDASGISGALARGSAYKPSQEGVIIYLATNDIRETLRKVLQSGGRELYPVTDNGDLGLVAEFEDSEGNRIALHQEAVKH